MRTTKYTKYTKRGFNHGWTRMNTDKEGVDTDFTNSHEFNKMANQFVRIREIRVNRFLFSYLLIRVNPCSSVVKKSSQLESRLDDCNAEGPLRFIGSGYLVAAPLLWALCG